MEELVPGSPSFAMWHGDALVCPLPCFAQIAELGGRVSEEQSGGAATL